MCGAPNVHVLRLIHHFRIYKLERKKYFDQMEDVKLRTRHVKAITSFGDGNATYIVFGMALEVQQHSVLSNVTCLISVKTNTMLRRLIKCLVNTP